MKILKGNLSRATENMCFLRPSVTILPLVRPLAASKYGGVWPR